MRVNKIVVFSRPEKVDFVEEPVPTPGPHEFIIQTEYTLISTGTELTALSGDFPSGSKWADYVKYPWKAGYSNVGRVIQVGDGVTRFKVGGRVATGGSHAKFSLVSEATRPIMVPDEIKPEWGTFGILGVTVLNGVRLAKVELGNSVVIFGLGLLGQLALQFLRMEGAYPIIGVDLSRVRLDLGRKLGLDVATDATGDVLKDFLKKAMGDRMPDIVFEITGNREVIPLALAAVKRQGKVVILSSPRGVSQIDFHDLVNARGISIIGAHVSTHPKYETPYAPWTRNRNLELFLELVKIGRIKVEPLISHRFPWEQAPEVYKMLLENRSQAMGVILEW